MFSRDGATRISLRNKVLLPAGEIASLDCSPFLLAMNCRCEPLLFISREPVVAPLVSVSPWVRPKMAACRRQV